MTLLHPGADPACLACKGLGLRVVPDGLYAVAVDCGCRAPVCPACKGTGFVSTGPGFRAPVRRCVCHEVALRARRLDAARLPARYADATFDTFDTSTGGAAARTHAKVRIDTWKPGERGIVFYGPVGRGKTHLAVACLRELVLAHGVTARFAEFTHLLGDLKAAFASGTAADVLDPLVTCDVLLIDELGKGRNTEFEGTVLDELVSRRYNAGAAVFGTTNYEPYKASTGRAVANAAERDPEQPALIDRVGERVFSRLREICDFLPVDGPDRRELRRARTASARRAMPG